MKEPVLAFALYGLYWILNMALWWPSLRKGLKENEFTMAIRTRDRKVLRYYAFCNGRLISGVKDGPVPDLLITWSDASSCFQVLLRSTANQSAPLYVTLPQAMVQAILDGHLELEGDAGRLLWFLEIVTEALKGIQPEGLYYTVQFLRNKDFSSLIDLWRQELQAKHRGGKKHRQGNSGRQFSAANPIVAEDRSQSPDDFHLRLEKLFARVKKGELSPAEIIEKAMAAIGRFKIDARGLKFAGRPSVDALRFQTMAEILTNAFDLLPNLMGKELVIEIRQMTLFKIKIALPPVISPLTKIDIKNKKLPKIEIDLNLISYLFQGVEGFLSLWAENLWKIHHLDIMMGWLGDDWAGGIRILDPIIPIFDLTTTEALENLRGPLGPLGDEVLTSCGV